MLVQTNEPNTMSTERKPVGIMAAIEAKTVPKQAPAIATSNPYTIKEHKEFMDKLDLAQVTAQELKDTFERAVGSEGNLKAELSKLKVAELKDMLRGSFYRSEKKEYLIGKVYERVLMGFSLSESFMWQPFSETYNDAMRRQVYEASDEKILERAETLSRREKFLKKALINPETKEEYNLFILYRGEKSLSSEQKVVWDEFQAINSLATQEQRLAQKAIVSKVDLGNVKLELVKHFHTHRNHDVFIVTMSERVDKEVYEELCKKARQLGGNYSKPWRDKATGSLSPGGFMFNNETEAQKFMQLKESDISRLDDLKAHQEEVQANAIEHLQEVAESLTEKAKESQSVERKVNTERKARFAANAEKEAEYNLFLASTLENIAEAICSQQTKYLSNIRAKTHIETLEYILRSTKWEKAKKESKRYEDVKDDDPIVDDVELIEYPYPTLHFSHLKDASSIKQAKGITLIIKRLTKLFNQKDKDKGYITIKNTYLVEDIKKLVSKIRPFDKLLAEYMSDRYAHYERLQVMGLPNLPTLRTALREYFSYRGEQKKLDPIKQMERALIGTKIEGYFPTPKVVVEQMLELAEIEEGMTVIEPNGGKGNIADLIRERHPQANLSVIEINSRLRDILIAKGHNLVGWNFLEHQGSYDRVLMNPPFEEHQDIQHIKFAHSLLNPGGKVVAIMSESPFFRMDKESVSFRDWLESVGGTSEKLPSGSFLDSERSTGVATRLVVISKPKINSDSKEMEVLDVDNPNVDTNNSIDITVENSFTESFTQVESEKHSEVLISEETNIVDEIPNEVEVANEVDEVSDEAIEETSELELNLLVQESEEIKLDTTNTMDIAPSEKVLGFDEYEEIRNNFLQHQETYEQIKMNPITHGWQDIEHTYHAYYLLNPGGKLVSTIADEMLLPNKKEVIHFRKWLKSVSATVEKLNGKTLVIITKNTLF
ncbi:MAG: hypothetical protein WAQ98_17720 [Blastocatellia bacterium]